MIRRVGGGGGGGGGGGASWGPERLGGEEGVDEDFLVNAVRLVGRKPICMSGICVFKIILLMIQSSGRASSAAARGGPPVGLSHDPISNT